MHNYPLLLLFITLFASMYTLIIYSITNSQWASVFVTAAAALLFILENMELNSKLEECQRDMEFLKRTSSSKMLPQLFDLQREIKRLKHSVADQSDRLRNRMLGRYLGSTQSL
jgi:hypothetical protein